MEGTSRVINHGDLEIRLERSGDRQVVLLSGELDVATAHSFEETLRSVEEGNNYPIVVGLSGVTFIDSTGLMALAQAFSRSRLAEREFLLLRGSDPVQETFALTGLDADLPFVDSIDP